MYHLSEHTFSPINFNVIATSSRSSPLRGVDATLEARGERPKALAFTARARESSRARSSVDAVAEHLSTDPIGIIKQI